MRLTRCCAVATVAVWFAVHPMTARADLITFDLTGVAGNTLPFSGTFVHDNDVALIQFFVPVLSTVTMQTSSYAAGGFDPILGLFDSLGQRITDNDDVDTSAGLFDSSLQSVLAAGTYFLSLTQSPNYPSLFTLADGFDFDDDPNFTQTFYGPVSGCTAFIDWMQNCRTAAFAGQIAIAPQVPQTPVPEPATLGLLALGAGIGLARRRVTTARQ